MKALYSLAEHQSKKLIPKEISEMIGTIEPIQESNLATLTESAKGKSGRKLIVKMEAIHTGRTKNFTYYTEEGLKAGLSTWTQPYNKPVLTHHNEYNGEPIGRIIEAAYEETTLAGKGGLVFTVEITDPTAIEKVLDGRYSTVSIGASTNKVTCNICGTDRTESWCDHYPGQKYGEGDDTQFAHLIVGETYGREISYVNTPADENAGNRSVQVVDESVTKTNSTESVHLQIFQIAEGLMQSTSQPDINLYEKLDEDARKALDSLIKTTESGGQPVSNPITDPAVPTVPVTEAALQASLTEAKTQITTLETELAEANKAVTKAVIEQNRLTAKVDEMEAEQTNLLDENAKLLENEHKMLATRVVEHKQRLCKADVVGKETDEAVTEHVQRTKESLTDSLTELVTEMAAAKPQAGIITNPGIVNDPDPQGNTNESYSLADADKILKRMFNGKKKN